MTKTYELLIAFGEELSENSQKDLLEQVKTTIEKNKGNVKTTDSWGKRALAFQIKKSKNAFYWLLTVEGESNLPKVITDLLRVEEAVLRFLVSEVEKAPRVKKTKKHAVKTKKLDELVVR